MKEGSHPLISLNTAHFRTGIWIDTLFLQQLQTVDFLGVVDRFHADVGFVLIFANMDAAQ
jgi:hypothetical protein